MTTLIRREDFMRRLGVRRTTFDKMRANGELPAPVIVTGSLKCWVDSDVEAFIQARIAASHQRTLDETLST